MGEAGYRLVGNVIPLEGPGFATPTFQTFPANSLWVQDIGEDDVVEGFLRVDPPLDQQSVAIDAKVEQQVGQPAIYIFHGVSRRYIDTKDGLEAALREEHRKLRDRPYLQRTIGRFIEDEGLIAEANQRIEAQRSRQPAPDTKVVALGSGFKPRPSFSGGAWRKVASGGGRDAADFYPERHVQEKVYAETALDLLTVDVAYPGWEHQIGLMKSFYVRGASWFHQHFGASLSRLGDIHSDKFESVSREFERFLIPGFDWDAPFSRRQALDGLSLRARKPLRFDKAVRTILLCHYALATRDEYRSHVGPDDVFKHMRIQPASFYLSNFDHDSLSEFQRRDPQILNRLREMTGQRTRVVFGEMAHGHTVTHGLAERTRDALSQLFPEQSSGRVDWRYNPRFTRAAALSETLWD